MGIVSELETILPNIFQATVTNQDLIREVDLGPFKHRVDDGLPLRKAAFTCMDSLLDSTPHKIDLFEFIKYLKNGLVDESPDIQMLTYQIFYKVGTFHGAAIVGVLDTLPQSHVHHGDTAANSHTCSCEGGQAQQGQDE